MYKLSMVILILLITGCQNNKDNFTRTFEIEFRLAEHMPGDEFIEYQFRDFDKKFFLHKKVLCNNDDLLKANVIKFNDEFAVEIHFTEKGKRKWARVTENNIGKNIAILVDDTLVTCPVIKTKIDNGVAIVNGGFTKIEAEGIAESILNK